MLTHAITIYSPQQQTAVLIAHAAISELKNTVWRESNRKRFQFLTETKKNALSFHWQQLMKG